MAISTRTGNILSKLIRKLDELCVYTDSNAQLRSLTLAEPDGTEHDSPVGTKLVATQYASTKGKAIPVNKLDNGLAVADITLSPGTWVVHGQVRGCGTDGATSGDTIFATLSTNSKSFGKYGSAWCAGMTSGILGVAHYVSVLTLTSTTTYYLVCSRNNSTDATKKVLENNDEKNTGTYIQAVRIA